MKTKREYRIEKRDKNKFQAPSTNANQKGFLQNAQILIRRFSKIVFLPAKAPICNLFNFELYIKPPTDNRWPGHAQAL